MKKSLTLRALIISIIAILGTQSNDSMAQTSDSLDSRIIKKGFNFAPLPVVSYSSDLGFQYGLMCDIFYFGSGESYPEYLHKLSLEASTYTKGASVVNLFYDSKHLIKGLRTTMSVSYLPDPYFDFYGFNGYEAPHLDNLGESFYKINRDYLRIFADFQGHIAHNISWAAGISFRDYSISEVDLEGYEGADNLLSHYIDEGILSKDQCSGSALELKLGAVHDTRNRETDPTQGFFTELTLSASPDLFNGRDENYLRMNFMHRGYLPLIGEHLTLAYRLGYQGKVAGDMPFYLFSDMQTLYLNQTVSEGLGGRTSLRGMLRNSIVGEGYGWLNLELRYRFCKFNFIGQHWYFGINPFLDLGQVIAPYQQRAIQESSNPLLYSGNREALHLSGGIGGKIVMNENVVFTAEYGRAFDSRDGTGALYLGMNFIF